MNRKMRQLARKSALSVQVSEGAIRVVEDFSFDQPKTRQVADLLETFEATGKKVLILTAEADSNLYRSARNIPGVSVSGVDSITTYQILLADQILIQKSALERLEETLTAKAEGEAA